MLKPTHPGHYPNREMDCQNAVANEVKGLIASAVNAGWDEVETARAIKIVATMLLETLDGGRED
ncbi:hypothetical protein [Brucella pituitosa]|uniref:hypothetical protein n=1 Tax=Brucella pituitosa TaxID=571256 RepID=UPI0012601E5C|nr:hypothetical protein [Brucella pituitosa]